MGRSSHISSKPFRFSLSMVVKKVVNAAGGYAIYLFISALAEAKVACA
jgi:hypothetical protein